MERPLSQPRNIIGGHFVSIFIGLATFQLVGDVPWANGLAIACMMITKTSHPPAAPNCYYVWRIQLELLSNTSSNWLSHHSYFSFDY